ncbi:MAG: bulb-type lectin domain-containing protein, partial ['Waltheria sp.' little leaf phytoplasma]|nr:bulb-type lectin domain-containing protein ['Waltheria sp.' little leaf phytoplasma]
MKSFSAMAAIVLLLILSIIISSTSNGVAAQPRNSNSNITLGSSLTPTGRQTAWLSPSGVYAFGFYEQAKGRYDVGIFVAGIPQKPVVWTANRDDPPLPTSATLLLTTDGRLIVQSPQQREAYIINTSERIASASMLDTGNFVVYNSDQAIMWQSFDHPTTTILEGQRLLAGMELFSSISETDQSTGIFRLKMQADGNLVQYPVQTPDAGPYSYWSSATFGRGNNVSLNLDDDGHLYLLNSSGVNIRDISRGGHDTNGTVYLMKIDSDGIFRLYSYKLLLNQNGNQSVIWVSTDDKCDPKGLCGLNGYCVNEDRDAVCRCLPGFAQVMEGNSSSGCEKDFSTESCKTDHFYKILFYLEYHKVIEQESNKKKNFYLNNAYSKLTNFLINDN